MSVQTWMLDWCDSEEGFHGKYDHGKEIFESKEDLLDKLEELKAEYGETLEYKSGEVKLVMVSRYVFLSDLKKEDELEIPRKKQECPNCHSTDTKRETVNLSDVQRDNLEPAEIVVCQNCTYHWEYTGQ